MPNAGIAQGSLFVIKGQRVGPLAVVRATAFPLQTRLAGVSVQITVNGLVRDGIMYYVTAGQIAVILPSSTPLGTGSVTVTVEDQTSRPYPITVVASALGIFTRWQNGSGHAIAFLNGISLVEAVNAANPGDIVVFWGTGLSASTGDDATPAQQVDLVNIPLEAYVGGVRAEILFRGRNACCAAVDTIYVRIPAGPVGCEVPVVFRTGSHLSNTPTIAVAAAGRVCTPVGQTLTREDVVNQYTAKGSLNFGNVWLLRSTSIRYDRTAGSTNAETILASDDALASFTRYSAETYSIGASFGLPTYGTCTTGVGGSGPQPSWLDAGPQLQIAGPAGNRTVARRYTGPGVPVPYAIDYSATLGNAASYLLPGAYEVSGPGGVDVGAINWKFTVPPPFVWENRAALKEPNRASGITVTWSGGDPLGWVEIWGTIPVRYQGGTVFARFTCYERISARTFTVPPLILLAFPPTEEGGDLVLRANSEQRVAAAGFDHASVVTTDWITADAVYR